MVRAPQGVMLCAASASTCTLAALLLLSALMHYITDVRRGLPHAHLLLIIREADKPATPADVDRVVSAEIPDAQQQPRLHKLVETFMVHGPCGALDPRKPGRTLFPLRSYFVTHVFP